MDSNLNKYISDIQSICIQNSVRMYLYLDRGVRNSQIYSDVEKKNKKTPDFEFIHGFTQLVIVNAW